MPLNDTLPVCLGSGNPPRLVSLWEMLRAYAGRFVHVVSYLTSIEWSALRAAGAERSEQMDDTVIIAREVHGGRLKHTLDGLRTECEALGLSSTVRHLDTFLPIPLDSMDLMLLEESLRHTNVRFREDLEKHVFLQLNSDRASFYAEPIGQWRSIADRFKCDFDVEETRKSYALERYTASVFHCMKIVEAGVLELQMFLKQPDVKANFGSVLGKLENMTQKQEFQHLPPDLQPYRQFMIDILAQLHAVKDSWRNKVSHVDRYIIPEGIFTEAMARGIHDATLLLMTKMADGLPPLVT